MPVFVYYRVAEGQVAPTAVAVRAMQAALRASHGGLLCDLLRRPPQPGEPATLMETYAGALPAGFAATLERAAARAALPSPRHVELFEPLPALTGDRAPGRPVQG